MNSKFIQCLNFSVNDHSKAIFIVKVKRLMILRFSIKLIFVHFLQAFFNKHQTKQMKVFKFGGASVNSLERIKNVGQIIKQYNKEPLMVIISAMGKTTNALEKVVEAFY